ncbi:hypothetical protein [Tautonia marina]|uniref:hypothetical protein n=1 Tax=Tautonia marina TaxID=2653855 RepID=UPI001260C781|nr:hypothetical protein [Tautonia marina]
MLDFMLHINIQFYVGRAKGKPENERGPSDWYSPDPPRARLARSPTHDDPFRQHPPRQDHPLRPRLDRPTDAYGNPLPRVGYSTADAEWYASQLAEHAEPWAPWPDWTDERWTLSDAEADRLAAEAEAERRVESPSYL